MTIDGLLVEMSSLLGSRIFISSAEQNHFGNQRLLTSVGLSAPSTSGCSSTGESVGSNVLAELANLRIENQKIKDEIANLRELVEKLQTMNAPSATSAPAPSATEKAADAEDFDLFGSDDEEESEEKKKIVEERLKAYNEKKSKKAGPIAKSSVILDVKPWDDETDLAEMEKRVRSVEMDGLVWGGAKLIAIGYGIKKLQIISVVEDLKVSVDDMIDAITAFEDFVQSVDIVAFNKI